jgi:hypothetical protein
LRPIALRHVHLTHWNKSRHSFCSRR